MIDSGRAALPSVAPEREPRSPAVRLLKNSISVIRAAVDGIVDGLGPEQLAFRPSPKSPSIAWLVWHLSRVQDGQAAVLFGHRQVWHTGTWLARFALPFDRDADGHGQGPEEAATVWVESGTLLVDYHHAVSRRTVGALTSVTDADLARAVDDRQGARASLGDRLHRVVTDDLRLVGQATYLRGLLRHGPY
jgi:Protein of unknown function (DUF664)